MTSRAPDKPFAMPAETFDYVVIGAGSAGCVVANRLSSSGNETVLLLEAGPADGSLFIRMPAAFTYVIGGSRFDWGYQTVPEPHLEDRRIPCPRGRVLGGSSSINAMAFVRGHPADFDGWAEHGLPAWSFAHCLPYFKKLESFSRGGSHYRGEHGPLEVTAPDFSNPLCEVFLAACGQAGFPASDDTNGQQSEGFGVMDQTIHRGRRVSAADAYLHPFRGRPNLAIRAHCLVTRVLFDGDKAVVGVEYQRDGRVTQARARREVILCAGAINSPQVLMLSGIGNARDLGALGVDVVADLPGVGNGLQDHADVSVTQICTKPVTTTSAFQLHRKALLGLEWLLFKTGLGATNHFETAGYIRTDATLRRPDIQIAFLPLLASPDGTAPAAAHGYQASVMLLRPKSHGRVKLRSKEPRDSPEILFNYLESPADIDTLRAGVGQLRRIFAQPAFDPYRGPEVLPGDGVRSDDEIDGFVRQTAKSTHHPCCTCRMGIDEAAVVDEKGRVRGVDGLRVIDASIMPTITSGNINAPTIMIAEKLSDALCGNPPLPPLEALPAAG